MRIALGCLAIAAQMAACVSFTGSAPSGAPSSDAHDAGIDAAPPVTRDAGVATTTDSGAVVAPDAGQGVPGGMVLVDHGYAIDAREVTVDAWSTFKAAHADDTGITRSTRCQGHPFGPRAGCPAPGGHDLPQTCVSWCDAEAFCNAAGKRLCGTVGTGRPIMNDGDATNGDKDEWARACAGKQSTDRYPYGAGADGSKCNTQDYGLKALADAGSIATCEGGVPGLFDMSGNAGEWENACYGGNCLIRGGSYEHSVGDSRCDTLLGSATLDDVFSDVSFRCCADL